MKCICDEYHISISELINGERQSSSLDKANTEENTTLKTKDFLLAVKLSAVECLLVMTQIVGI